MSLKTSFALIFLQHAEGANCMGELSINFQIAGTTSISNLLANNTTPKLYNDVITINTDDYVNADLLDTNALAWVHAYLINKCLQKHKYVPCEKCSQENSDILKNETLFCYFKTLQNEENKFGNL